MRHAPGVVTIGEMRELALQPLCGTHVQPDHVPNPGRAHLNQVAELHRQPHTPASLAIGGGYPPDQGVVDVTLVAHFADQRRPVPPHS